MVYFIRLKVGILAGVYAQEFHRDRHYEFLNSRWTLRIPQTSFWSKKCPSRFLEIMHMLFGGMTEFVEIYLDDLTIHSETFEKHVEHIIQVIEKLEEANLKLNSAKCVWCAKEVKVLGHYVSYKSIKVDDAKIKAVKDWLEPRNVKNVQWF